MTEVRSPLERLVKVAPGEGAAVFWSFAYFFFLLASYYVIRPLRDEMGVSGGEGALTWLYLGTLAGTLAANPVFSALVSRFPRRVFIPVVYRFLILNLLVFYALLSWLPEENRLAVARAFFVWASVFNMFAVSVFWGFMADLFRSEQGKRLFGFIGMGGTLGAIAGASLTAGLAQTLGPLQLLLVAASLLEVAVLCVRRLAGRFVAESPRVDRAETPPGHEVFSGIRLVLDSRYLLGICLFLVFYTVSSTLLYFEQARIVRASLEGAAERTSFFAMIDLYVNLLSILTQFFFTARVLALIGVGATLAILPALTLAGFTGLGMAPVPSMLVLFQVTRRAAEYGLVRPAREVLFTVVTREEKYTSKNLIDTFVYRGGDVVGALLHKASSLLNLGAAGIAMAFVPIALAWAVTGLRLGRRQSVMAREQARRDYEPAS